MQYQKRRRIGMDFASTVKELRKRCLLSQMDFAKEIGVSFSTVNRWETGKTVPNFKTMKRMHQNKDMDKRINGLLSGLEKILSAIAEMRNKVSDSHGVGSKRINISDHHARLFVNSAMTMADFVLAVSEKASFH